MIIIKIHELLILRYGLQIRKKPLEIINKIHLTLVIK